MKMYKLTLAAALTACLLTAGLASACGDKASTTASGKAGCTKMAAKGCCAHGATQTTAATMGRAADLKTCTFTAGTVAFKGTVLCNHCDLHKADTCQTMFRTDRGCLFTMAGDKASALREDAVGGKKLVRVKGTLSEDGELSVGSYRVIRALDSGASAM